MTSFDALSPIYQQIEETATDGKLQVKKLSEVDTKEFVEKISLKYCDNIQGEVIWETLLKAVDKLESECVAVSNDNAWRWIDEFIVNNQAILFFNPSEEKVSFEFNNGEDIVKVLENCYDFEFYVSNRSLDYLICFNHHRILYACGTASKWLSKYKTSEYDFFLQ
ncbi:hypothetical protein CHH83_22945 [Bacillus sp. 7586-K]|nr:hypothetical protein CHH83_22945 [Bacillus sp. 7586-K]